MGSEQQQMQGSVAVAALRRAVVTVRALCMFVPGLWLMHSVINQPSYSPYAAPRSSHLSLTQLLIPPGPPSIYLLRNHHMYCCLGLYQMETSYSFAFFS